MQECRGDRRKKRPQNNIEHIFPSLGSTLGQILALLFLDPSPLLNKPLHLPNALILRMDSVNQLRRRKTLLNLHTRLLRLLDKINLPPKPSRLTTKVLRRPASLPQRFALLLTQNSGPVSNALSERRDDTLNDMVHVFALRRTGRKFNYVAGAEGVGRVGD